MPAGSKRLPGVLLPPCPPQDERKAAAVKLLEGVRVPRDDLYIPTNPDCRVLEVIPESAAPMQASSTPAGAV